MNNNNYVTKETFDGSIKLILSKLDKMESAMELKFQNFETRMNNLETSINKIELKMNNIETQLKDINNQTKIHRVE